jgi:hypothetical protein
MSKTYELWVDGERSEMTFIPSDHPQWGIHTVGCTKLWEVEADSWEEACTKRNEYLGWAPYKPMGSDLEGEEDEPPDFHSGD